MMSRFLIGIDEAGRAPLAGPVSVGLVMVPENMDVLKVFSGVKDSKMLTPEKREEIYAKVVEREAAGDIRFCVRYSEHTYIDAFGITKAVHRAIASGVRALSPSTNHVHVLLDGLLHAPSNYSQETIIHGDVLVPVISLASVVAKVRRDHLMTRMARKYPSYGFDRHKGYPTKQHYAAIERFGLCSIHRATYCRERNASHTKGVTSQTEGALRAPKATPPLEESPYHG